MGRAKGGKNRRWKKEEKLRIIQRYFEERMSLRDLAKEEKLEQSLISV